MQLTNVAGGLSLTLNILYVYNIYIYIHIEMLSSNVIMSDENWSSKHLGGIKGQERCEKNIISRGEAKTY